jgi:shikimate kinase
MDGRRLYLPHLVLIYGPPLVGKSSLAREVASRLGEQSALVSVDGLLHESIVMSGADAFAELEMVHTQARLMVANYLKNSYNVVQEGCFFYQRDGNLYRHEQELDQTVALMRNLARAPLLVRLSLTEEELLRRAKATGREQDIDLNRRIEAEYKARYGRTAMTLEADGTPVEDLAERVVERLEQERIA